MRAAFLRWLPAALLAASTAAAVPLNVPVQQGATPQAFVPAGWAVELSVDGELDGDAEMDRVLVLLQKTSVQGDRKRALLVLLKNAGGWSLAGTSASLLPCFQC